MNCRYCGRSMANAWEEEMCRMNVVLDSLTPSHDAQEAKDGQVEVSQVQVTPSVPLDVVVEAPDNHPKQLND